MNTFWNILYFVLGFYMGYIFGVPLVKLIESIMQEFRK